MKKNGIILLLLIASLFSNSFNFSHIPIQEQGRIKPLDSFARNQLLSFYGKSELTLIKQDTTYKQNAINWLFRVLTREEEIFSDNIFKIENPDVSNMLNLKQKKRPIYSFNEIDEGLLNNIDFIRNIQTLKEDERTLIERQILDLWIKRSIFINLSNSAITLLPIIRIENEKISNAIEVESGAMISYSYYIRNKNVIHENLSKLFNEDSFHENENLLFELNKIMETINLMNNSQFHFIDNNILKILPGTNEQQSWISPNTLINQLNANNSSVSITQNNMLTNLEMIFNLEQLKNDVASDLNYHSFHETVKNELEINSDLLIREVNYNKSNLLLWSLIFYLISLCMLISIPMLNIKNVKYKLAPLILIAIGFLYHLSAIIIRMTILKRPPVSTLYESIIFVGLIAVLFSIILELMKKDNLSILIGSIAGIILHYISFGYAADGDTFGVLVAVLNSNFWLATHVTTITIGYGTTLIASLVGHLYLIKANWNPNNKKSLKLIYNNMLATTFIALFFTMFGTILGGIWGDQSWGRFWGWDPKENGALLIVMWLLMMIHLRLSGMVKANGYALGLVLANITVALAWFGVNLLNIGLHSYGFTEGVFVNLFLFIAFELCFGIALYMRLKIKS